jgi:hypothetical protein
VNVRSQTTALRFWFLSRSIGCLMPGWSQAVAERSDLRRQPKSAKRAGASPVRERCGSKTAQTRRTESGSQTQAGRKSAQGRTKAPGAACASEAYRPERCTASCAGQATSRHAESP